MRLAITRAETDVRARTALRMAKRKRDLLFAVLKIALAFAAIEVAVLGFSDGVRYQALMAQVRQVLRP